MRIPGVKTGKIFFRWLRARVLGGALILGYHRISLTDDDVYGTCVSPENFARHMESLRRYAHPISFPDSAEFEGGPSSPNSVVVTFDGYADNLYVAKPMEKYEIGNRVHLHGVCGGILRDELRRRIISSRADPRRLRLRLAIQFGGIRPR
jgi:hypothetical protein